MILVSRSVSLPLLQFQLADHMPVVVCVILKIFKKTVSFFFTEATDHVCQSLFASIAIDPCDDGRFGLSSSVLTGPLLLIDGDYEAVVFSWGICSRDEVAFTVLELAI